MCVEICFSFKKCTNELNMGLALRTLVQKTIHELEVGCPRCVIVKELDYLIIVSEFELQSRNYGHVRKNTLGMGMNPYLILRGMGEIIPLLFFEKDSFCIKLPYHVYMPYTLTNFTIIILPITRKIEKANSMDVFLVRCPFFSSCVKVRNSGELWYHSKWGRTPVE